MSAEAVCRECRTDLKGASYLMLGARLRGSNRLCLSCIDKYGARHAHDSLRSLVVCYTKEVKPDTVQSLKKRVAELEALAKLNGFTDV